MRIPAPPPGRDARSWRRGQRIKRALDVGLGAAALAALSPVIGAIGAAIWATDGSPVLFRQRRPGLDGEIFEMVKFRTMRAPRAGEDSWSSDAVRVTRLGQILRRTSLDELPELVNVVRGDMSLVGPRPLLEEYLPKYSAEQSLRHLVRPGVTGLAQVSGRRALMFSQRLQLDVEYVRRWSLLLDAKILVQTLLEPFRQGSDEDQALEDVDDLGFLTRA